MKLRKLKKWGKRIFESRYNYLFDRDVHYFDWLEYSSQFYPPLGAVKVKELGTGKSVLPRFLKPWQTHPETKRVRTRRIKL